MSKRKPARTIKARSASKIRSKAAGGHALVRVVTQLFDPSKPISPSPREAQAPVARRSTM
jgi:hypothetical protein